MKSIRVLCLLFCLLQGSLWAQAPSETPCSDPRYRQFDFWIGEWEVFVGEKMVGVNRIERILDGCVIMENWQGKGGSLGHSFNIFNVLSGKWEQTWVDNTGGVIYFKGDYNADAKLMAFTALGADTTQHKMNFWQLPDGSVRQRWEAAAKGEDFRVLFEGIYRKKVVPVKGED